MVKEAVADDIGLESMCESWECALITAGSFISGTWTGGGCLSHLVVFGKIMCNALQLEQHVIMCLWSPL